MFVSLCMQVCVHVLWACLWSHLCLCVPRPWAQSGGWGTGKRQLGAITPSQAWPAPDHSHLLIALVD